MTQGEGETKLNYGGNTSRTVVIWYRTVREKCLRFGSESVDETEADTDSDRPQ